MEFKHLPSAGGLYDQNPDILDKFMLIFGAQAEERERRDAAEKRKGGGPTPKNR